jgi:hypothetical protein
MSVYARRSADARQEAQARAVGSKEYANYLAVASVYEHVVADLERFVPPSVLRIDDDDVAFPEKS